MPSEQDVSQKTDEADTRPSVVTAETLAALRTGYRSLQTEYDYWITPDLIEGAIPQELTGTLFRNGPGQLEIFGKKLNHPFDGDGMVCSFAFKDGKGFFRNRYVRTKGFVDEQKQRRMLYKGAFASGNPTGSWFYNPFDFTIKNIGNTGVLHWAGRLYALHESGLPYEMDPATLETVQETNLGGAVDGKGPLAAHYRITREADGSRRWVTFGAAVAGLDANVSFFEFGEEGALLHKTVHKFKGAAFGFFHDLAVSEHYYILLQNPTRLDFRKLLTSYVLGRCAIAECIIYDTRLKTKVLLVPRPSRGAEHTVKVLETEPFFSFHHINAYEVKGDKIVLDTLAWNQLNFSQNLDTLNPDQFKGGQRTEMNRMVLDLATGTVSRQPLCHRTCEFSVINMARVARPHRYCWSPAAAVDDPVLHGPNQVLMKTTIPADAGLNKDIDPASIKTEVWAAGPLRFTQEPLFVARPGATAEDDGWIFMMLHNGETEKAELCIFDAQNVIKGPLCTIKLPHVIPFGLHGSWDQTYFGPKEMPATLPSAWQPLCAQEIGH